MRDLEHIVGKNANTVYWAMGEDPIRTSEVAGMCGISCSQATTALNRLLAADLATKYKQGWWGRLDLPVAKDQNAADRMMCANAALRGRIKGMQNYILSLESALWHADQRALDNIRLDRWRKGGDK